MTGKQLLWITITILATLSVPVMIGAILTAPAYIAVPVAVYLSGVALIAVIGAGRHVVRNV